MILLVLGLGISSVVGIFETVVHQIPLIIIFNPQFSEWLVMSELNHLR